MGNPHNDKFDAGIRALTARNVDRRKILKTGLALGVGLAAPSIIGVRGAAAATTLRFGSDSPLKAPHTVSATSFKADVEKRTEGRIRVSIFPDAQLGSNEVMTNSVKAGTLDAVVTDVANVSAAVPAADVFSLPFLFKDTPHAIRAANGSVGGKLTGAIEQAYQFNVLGWATDGARNMWNSKRPIHTPDDLEGLKMRVQPSQIQRDTYSAFGALPTPISLSEVYTSLQSGVVDGADFSPVDMMQLKMYQVTKYLTLTRHFSIIGVMIISQSFMSKLSAADQEIVREAGKTAADAQVQAVLSAEQQAVEDLKKKKIQVFDMADPQAFVSKVETVYQNNSDKVGKDLIAEARKTA
jgi:tripartite ATP-independent transporter DctP family solute receptor